jgi:hypothetical protein
MSTKTTATDVSKVLRTFSVTHNGITISVDEIKGDKEGATRFIRTDRTKFADMKDAQFKEFQAFEAWKIAQKPEKVKKTVDVEAERRKAYVNAAEFEKGSERKEVLLNSAKAGHIALAFGATKGERRDIASLGGLDETAQEVSAVAIPKAKGGHKVVTSSLVTRLATKLANFEEAKATFGRSSREAYDAKIALRAETATATAKAA